MNKASLKYRFFCVVTAMAVLLSSGIPISLHATGITAHCHLPHEGAHEMSHNAAPDHGSSASERAQHRHLLTDDHHRMSTGSHNEAANCEPGFTCSCTTDDTADHSKAVPTHSKSPAGHAPVITQTLDFLTGQTRDSFPEPVFVALYSPPLFLINGSFLN